MTNERKVIYLDDALGILDDLQRGYENGFNIYADSRKQMLDLSFVQPEGRSGVFIPDITVKNLQKAPLEAVEKLLVLGEMEDIVFSSKQPAKEHPLLKIIQDFKEETGCKDILIVQKDAMKAWDENGVEYTMQLQQECKGEWIRGDAEKLTGKWRCSICGNTIYSETKRDREKFHAFCGHCGAKMN